MVECQYNMYETADGLVVDAARVSYRRAALSGVRTCAHNCRRITVEGVEVHSLATVQKRITAGVVNLQNVVYGLEYKTIAKESQQSGCDFILSSVPESLLESQDLKDLATLGAKGKTDSIEVYFASNKERICLLDPAAKQELEPRDGANFDVFLFGGILGR